MTVSHSSNARQANASIYRPSHKALIFGLLDLAFGEHNATKIFAVSTLIHSDARARKVCRIFKNIL